MIVSDANKYLVQSTTTILNQIRNDNENFRFITCLTLGAAFTQAFIPAQLAKCNVKMGVTFHCCLVSQQIVISTI